ncbi:MAG: MarR family transcriptional regulator [Planctomycetes bacterium]|nr:MarR family transcriptional regulator [Planctomycetota bacterium]
MADFTPKQGQYLAFIHAYTEGFGFPPAESEIAKAMNVSPPSVNQMMKTLERKSLIRRRAGEPRSVEILVSPDVIPKWKKRITSTRRIWVRVDPTERSTGRSKGEVTVYRFKITLKNTRPPIWRRIETKDVTLQKLHELTQTAMGWTNSHLHQFEIGDTRYANPRFMEHAGDDFGAISYAGVRVSDLVSQHGTKLQIDYEYDFGDGWQHSIVLEKVTDGEPGVRYPRCIDGDRACPPEDVGGVWGFADFVEAITNSDHEQHEEFLEWNGPFDATEFDAKKATRRMREGLPAW